MHSETVMASLKRMIGNNVVSKEHKILIYCCLCKRAKFIKSQNL